MAEAFEKQYELLDHLGEGSFAIVRACRRRTDSMVLACKSLRSETLQSKIFQEGCTPKQQFKGWGTYADIHSLTHTPTNAHICLETYLQISNTRLT